MDYQCQDETYEFEPASFFESFLTVSRELIVRPKKFFSRLPRGGRLKNAFIFLTVCSFLSALLTANARTGDYRLFLLLFFANIVSAFVGSFMLHGIVSRFFGSPVLFPATFRIIAYTSLLDVVSWIPLAGPLAYFYELYLVFMGLQEVHRLNPRQAGTAVISIVLIVSLLAASMLIMAPDALQESLKLVDPENTQF